VATSQRRIEEAKAEVVKQAFVSIRENERGAMTEEAEDEAVKRALDLAELFMHNVVRQTELLGFILDELKAQR
jgi:hypothetical protein